MERAPSALVPDAGSNPAVRTERKGEEKVNDFIAVEDGHTFLSQEELDTYRTQKIQMEYEEGGG